MSRDILDKENFVDCSSVRHPILDWVNKDRFM